MSQDSAIEWTDATWNPVAGCSLVSPGCANCYAMTMAARLEKMDQQKYFGLTKKVNGRAVWIGAIRLDEAALQIPLTRKKPTRYFVNSMSDLFHEGVPDAFIDKVFAVMALCPQHTFQVLTKRAERMAAYFNGPLLYDRARFVRQSLLDAQDGEKPDVLFQQYMAAIDRLSVRKDHPPEWPLPNVWLGVSAEDQQRADERIPHLLRTPAAVRFVSYEPALGAVDFHGARPGSLTKRAYLSHHIDTTKFTDNVVRERIDWVIVGGESGHGARRFDINWARGVVAQCKAAGVACFVKQMGARPFDGEFAIEGWGKKGERLALWPKELQVREFPRVENGVPY